MHLVLILHLLIAHISQSHEGNLQWNYQYPEGVYEPLEVGQKWPSRCEYELQCLHPTTPILGPQDPRYQHLVQVSSLYIVTGSRQLSSKNDYFSDGRTVSGRNDRLASNDKQWLSDVALVMPNLEAALNLLAVWVSNEWTGMRLQINRAYVPDCQYLSYDMLHCEGRAVDVQLFGDFDPDKYAIVAWMATKAGFHFVHRESLFSMHLSVEYRAAVRRSEMTGACFTGSSKVTTVEGHSKTLEDLHQGDVILTWDDNRNQIIGTTFISWLHKDENATAYFLSIRHEHGETTVTPDHHIFLWNGRSIFAGQLSVGVDIRFMNPNGTSIRSTVSNIQGFTATGLYAPLTDKGHLIVDNVWYSNFAKVTRPFFGQLAMFPFTCVLAPSQNTQLLLQWYVDILHYLTANLMSQVLIY